MKFLGETANRYENALKWLRMIAGLHYFGAAFDPEHMHDLANIAGDALAGRDIRDYDEAMAQSRPFRAADLDQAMREALEMAADLGHNLAEEGKGRRD